MKPVGIFQFAVRQGPGYFTQFLDQRGVPWELIRIDAGAPMPQDASGYSGICLMGGPMSVNDPLPWIPKVLGMVREAFVQDIPMIGHCLGGQLISKGLGGRVRANPVKEIGWAELFAEQSAQAKAWLGHFVDAPFTVFQWHGETFDIPMQANLLAANRFCTNQIVSLGPHLAMQCHIEMTQSLIESWCEEWHADHYQPGASVQHPAEILGQLADNLPKLHKFADTVYGHWLSSVIQERRAK